MSEMNHVRLGAGKPLLLVHGLGSHWRTWQPILDALAAEREVIAVDLPGFGDTPPLPGKATLPALADALVDFLEAHDLLGVDAVGHSMGGHLVLELVRRGKLGAVVSLDPGGFWRGWERHAVYAALAVSIRLVRLLQPAMPWLTGNAVTRTLLFAQLSARPWRLSPQLTLQEMRSFAAATSFDDLRNQLPYETQQGAPRGSIAAPLVIGWGRKDRSCLPRQAGRAQDLFPDARLHWLEHCGHLSLWDAPREVARLVLETTAGPYATGAGSEASARGGYQQLGDERV